jgi:hypothetical protein
MRRLLVVATALALVGCTSPSVESAWEELEPMEVARSEHPAVVLGEELVVLGGFVEAGPGRVGVTASVEAYLPGSDTWRRLPDLPAPRHHLMAAEVDGRLYAMGGFSETGFESVADVWELVGGTWESRSSLPSPVGAGAAVVESGTVYVVGGVPDGGLLAYQPGLDRWETLASPNVAREHLAAAVLDGEIWAIAGRWSGAIHSSTEIYDPGSGTWREGPPLVEARSGFGAVAVGDTIVVAGGEVFGPDRSLATSELLALGEWVGFEPIPFGLHGNPLLVVGDRLYLPGGSTRANGVENPGTLFSYPVPDP